MTHQQDIRITTIVRKFGSHTRLRDSYIGLRINRKVNCTLYLYQTSQNIDYINLLTCILSIIYNASNIKQQEINDMNKLNEWMIKKKRN